MILTIAKIIAIWTLASIPAAILLGRILHAADQGPSHGQPDEPRCGGEVDIRKIHNGSASK